jgi:hypothetical protein
MISISLSSCNAAIFRLACANSHITGCRYVFSCDLPVLLAAPGAASVAGRQAALAAVGSLLVAANRGGHSGGGGRATAGLGGGGGSFDAGLPAFWWPVSRLATASA